MNRDEILDAIKSASTVSNPDPQYVPEPGEVADRVREVARLADAYMGNETGDTQYLAEALTDALEGFADMLARIS